MAVIGTIEYDAIVNTDKLDSGVKKVEGVVKGVGAATAAIAAAGVVAAGALVASSVKAYAEYEQLVGGVDTLFKESSKTVQQYADNAFQTAGLSANEYMSTVTSFSASLLQGLGGDTAKAAEISNMAVTDMADNANKMGTSMELIQNAYQGFAKDNFTMLDNLKLGYGGTASEMARLVNDSGVMGESFKATAENVKDIPFDQLIAAIHKTQEEMGITGTTALEASKTISGAFNSTKAAWENVLTAFGTGNNEAIKAAVDGLIQSATNLVNNVSVILPSIIAGLGQALVQIIQQLPALLNTIIPVFANIFSQLVTTVLQTIPKILPVVIQLLMAIINTIIDNLPLFIDAAVQLIVALIQGLTEALPQLIPKALEAVQTIVKGLLDNLDLIIRSGIELLVALIVGLADALPQLVAMVPTIITTIVKILTEPSMIRLLVGAALQIMIAIGKGLIQSIWEITKQIPSIVGSIVSGFIGLWGTYMSIGWDLVRGIWNGISDAKNWVLDKIKGFGKAVLDGIKGFFGIHSPSSLFRDEIGKNLALGVGEGFTDGMKDVTKDMENALPNPSLAIDNMGTVEDFTTGSTTQTIVVKVGEETIATKIVELINEKTRLSGNNAILV